MGWDGMIMEDGRCHLNSTEHRILPSQPIRNTICSKSNTHLIIFLPTMQLYLFADMSFLQLIAKPERASSNPAFQHLKRPHLPQGHSFKSEPKQPPSDSPQPIRNPYGVKPRTASLTRTIFARGKNPKNSNEPPPTPSHPPDSLPSRQSPSPSPSASPPLKNNPPARTQYHHSFSNYLSAKAPAGGRRSNLQGKLMYFDLNEIVNKISSPIKLEPKVEEDDLDMIGEGERVKQPSLALYQKFLGEVHKERNRYHHRYMEEGVLLRTEETRKGSRKQLNLLEREGIRKRPNTLWLRRPAERRREGDGIQPWMEDEEHHSPIRGKKHHSAFQAHHHPIVEDLQDLMA